MQIPLPRSLAEKRSVKRWTLGAMEGAGVRCHGQGEIYGEKDQERRKEAGKRKSLKTVEIIDGGRKEGTQKTGNFASGAGRALLVRPEGHRDAREGQENHQGGF